MLIKVKKLRLIWNNVKEHKSYNNVVKAINCSCKKSPSGKFKGFYLQFYRICANRATNLCSSLQVAYILQAPQSRHGQDSGLHFWITILHLSMVSSSFVQGDHRNQKAIFQPFWAKTGVFLAFYFGWNIHIFFQPLVTKNIVYSSLIYKLIHN